MASLEGTNHRQCRDYEGVLGCHGQTRQEQESEGNVWFIVNFHGQTRQEQESEGNGLL